MAHKNRRKETKFHSNKFKTSAKRGSNFKANQKSTSVNTKSFSAPRRSTNHSSSIGEETRGAHSLKAAQKEYDSMRRKNSQLREQAAKRQEEIKIALHKYNQRKQHKNRKLMAKTSKGQPIMKNRIEILFEKIRSSMVS